MAAKLKARSSKRSMKKPIRNNKKSTNRAKAKVTKARKTTSSRAKAKVTSIIGKLKSKAKGKSNKEASKSKVKSKAKTSNVRSIAAARKRKLSKSSSINIAKKSSNANAIKSMFHNVVNNVLVDIKKIPFTQFTKDREKERLELIHDLKHKQQSCILAKKLIKDINKGSNVIIRLLQKQKGPNRILGKKCNKFKTILGKTSGQKDTLELRLFDLQTTAGIFGELVLVMHSSCKDVIQYRKALSKNDRNKLKHEIQLVNRKIKSYLTANDMYLPSNISSALATVTGLVQTVLIGAAERKAS